MDRVVTHKSPFRILARRDVTLKSSIRSSLYYPTVKILLLLLLPATGAVTKGKE